MKTIKWFFALTCLCLWHLTNGQQNLKLFYDAAGKKTTEAQAQFYLTIKGNNQAEGRYINEKLYFKGEIIKLDTSNYLASQFKDSCFWYYKNGSQKFVKSFDEKGQLNGISKDYYESGSLWKEYKYTNGILENNTYTEFIEDGQRFEIYEDQFNDNSSDWELIQNADQDVKIADGQLSLTALTKTGTSRYKYLKFNKEDFIIETIIEFVKNKKEDKGGLIYGFKDWNNYNFFYINNESVYIGTVYEGVKSLTIDDMFSSAINENGPNTLKMISNGGDVIYTINGNVVYKSSKYNFYGNNFGLAILGKFTMKVDLIRFKQVSYSAMGNGNQSKGQQNVDIKSSGTGFFIHPSGIIATNFHVIENEKQIIVDVLDTASSSYSSYRATVLMKDMDNDLAILKITDNAFKPIFDSIYYSFSTTNSFELGSNAFTLGFPLALAGMGASEVKFSDGKISAKTGYNGALNSFQTTIPVQPGNSGGPIFNEYGELIGIINSKISKADNVSYGIKNNFLINLVQSLSENVVLSNQHSEKSNNMEENIKKIKKYIVLIKVK